MSYAYAPWHLRRLRHSGSSQDDVNENGFSNLASLDPGYAGPSHDALSNRHTHSALQVFCRGDKGLTRRIGLVDGDEVTFELLENLTKERPKIGRKEREKITVDTINQQPSSWDLRARWWLMEYHVTSLTLMYVMAYLSLNFVFAALWSIQEGKCCDDATMSYTQVFDFAVQTSLTIGYGGYVPDGPVANLLVVVISIVTFILNSVYAGLLFMKFVSPAAKIRFSEVMTLSNVNGIPCLELRVGNEDSDRNILLNPEVDISYRFTMEFSNEKGETRSIDQTQDLKLLCSRRVSLDRFVWTLRHLVDENSPLFGLDLLKPPGSQIASIDVSIQATQRVTGAPVFADACYLIEDIMIGHRFVDQIIYDPVTRKGSIDYSKFDETVPQPVWYPVERQNQ